MHIPKYNKEHKVSVESANKHLNTLYTKMQDNSQIPPIPQCITELKNGKAADMFGITSEHLRHAGRAVAKLIAELIQNIVNDCVLPPCLKTGVITPEQKLPTIAGQL